MAKIFNAESKSGKKRTGLILAAAVCAALAVGGATAGFTLGGCADKPVEEVVTEVQRPEFVFSESTDECVLVEYVGTGGEVVIPESHEGKPVTALVDDVFTGNHDVTSITIPGSIEKIDDNAFEECDNLRSVTIGDGVNYIGESAFSRCVNLTEINIPESVTFIGSSAFSECVSLEKIVIPESVTHLGFHIFDGCSGLTEATLGGNVRFGSSDKGEISYDSYMFSDCSALKEIHVSEASISCKDKDGVVYSKDGTKLLYCPRGKEGKLEISAYVTKVDERALRNCGDITSVTFMSRLTEFDASYFNGCDSLLSINVVEDHEQYSSADGVLYSKDGSEIVLFPEGREGSFAIPEGVISIGDYAFSGCDNLTEITIPDSVTSVGDYAFSDCDGLTEINIPDGVTTIGTGAFSGCKSVIIPNSVTTVGEYAFEGCGSVTVSDSLANFGAKAFADWRNTSVKVAEDSKKFKMVDGVIYSKDGKTLVLYSCNSENSSFAIPDGVTSIGDYAFYNCEMLTEITIPASVRNIGDYAFANCHELAEIAIPEGVTSLGDFAFSSCKELTSIAIPASVTRMSGKTFARLASAYIYEGLNSIDVAEGNRHYKSVDGAVFTKDGKTLIKVPDAAKGSYTVPEGVTAIDDYAFYGCGELSEVVLPEGVTTIGNYAFDGSGIYKIDIPESVTEIGEFALGSIGEITAPYDAEHYGYTMYDTNEWVVEE